MAYMGHLRDDQWDLIGPYLLGKSGDVGLTAKDKRRFVEGVIWVGQNGGRWRSLPKEYSKCSSVHKRFKRWADKGYNADYIVKSAEFMGAEAVILPRSMKKTPDNYPLLFHQVCCSKLSKHAY
jgi:hypothetical protein